MFAVNGFLQRCPVFAEESKPFAPVFGMEIKFYADDYPSSLFGCFPRNDFIYVRGKSQ